MIASQAKKGQITAFFLGFKLHGNARICDWILLLCPRLRDFPHVMSMNKEIFPILGTSRTSVKIS